MLNRLPAVFVFAGFLLAPHGAAAQSLLSSSTPVPIAEDDAVRDDDAPGADVAGALFDSFKLLMTEHAVRIASQEKTRRELSGPFWADYRASLRMPRNWEDSDGWLVNYVGHPLHGAASGFVFMLHDPRSAREPFGLNIHYWSTRWRAIAWSAGYSLQFEVGPLSEASIGNVGLRPETTGWVDYVVTPTGAFALIVGEDALDRFFVRWVETKTTNRFFRASLRMLFNPSRTMANLSANKAPWFRDTRTLGWR